MGTYTRDSKYVVTTPNVDFVPEPFVGQVRVIMRRDYRFGENDPFQWPQIFTGEFDFLCVLRRPTSRYGVMWWAPDPLEDFRTIQGSAFTCLGRLEELAF